MNRKELYDHIESVVTAIGHYEGEERNLGKSPLSFSQNWYIYHKTLPWEQRYTDFDYLDNAINSFLDLEYKE